MTDTTLIQLDDNGIFAANIEELVEELVEDQARWHLRWTAHRAADKAAALTLRVVELQLKTQGLLD